MFPYWKCERLGAVVQLRLLLRVFFLSFFYKQVLLSVVAVEGFTTIGTLDLKESYHHSGPSPMRLNELWTCPDDGAARAEASGCQRSSCRSVQRGRGGDWCSQRRS